jgi:putative transcriptional regulator
VSDTVDSLAPGFLVAMPQLADPSFRRTVVLLVAHGPEGTLGFVVNRPLPATVTEVLEGLSIPWQGDAEEAVHFGGPVLPQGGWVLFGVPTGRSAPEESQLVLPGLHVTPSLAVLRDLAEAPPARFRLLLGHAGWGAGQLEAELVEGAWLLVPPTAELIFDVPVEDIWELAIRSLGVDPASIVPGHGIQ